MKEKKKVNKKAVKNKNGRGQDRIKKQRLSYLIGDIEVFPNIKVPELSPHNPYVTKLADPDNPKFMTINSPLIGALEEADPTVSPLRNALKIAETGKADAVIMAGNLIYFITEHYGSTYPYKTQAVDLPIDPKILNKAYPEAVIKDSGTIESRLEKNKIVFIPVKTRLDLVIAKAKKEFFDESGNRLFNGPILITFGSIEEALAMQHTNERLRIDVFREKAYAQGKVRELQNELRSEKRLATPNEVKIVKIEKDIDDFLKYERIFVKMGNVSSDYINRTTDNMISYLISRYETDIPDSKVISIGDAHIKAGNRLIQTTYEKTGESLNDGFAGRIRKDTYSRIKNNEGELIPDVILGAGLNPTFRNLLVSHRVREKKATLDDVKLCHCIQLTTCIDDVRYRKAARKRVRLKDSLTRLASKDKFTAGVLWLEWNGNFFLPKFFSGECLTKAENFKSESAIKKLFADRLYNYKEGCSHYGGKFIAIYPSPNDPDGRYIKFHYQVAFELMNKIKAPIAGYQHDGDACHWINYQTWLETPQEWLDLETFLNEVTKIEKSSAPIEERLRTLKVAALENYIKTGIIDPDKQVDSYVLSMEPYLEFWARILEYCKENGIEFRGKYSAITQGRGNHNEHSFPKHASVDISEAKLIRQAMVASLFKKYPNLSELIEKNFTSPHMGKLGYANGVFAYVKENDKRNLTKDQLLLQKDFYVYAAKMKHKQGSSKTADNMAKMVEAFGKQGTSNQYESGRMSVNMAGDDHFGGIAITRTAFHVKTGCQCFENEFGKRFDFPEQNLFSAIWSVPANGPSSGPLGWIFLDYGLLRKYAVRPFSVSRGKIFQGAIGLESDKDKK